MGGKPPGSLGGFPRYPNGLAYTGAVLVGMLPEHHDL